MDYPTYVPQVLGLLDLDALITNPLLAAPTSDALVNSAIPEPIFYAENRMQRLLDLLTTCVRDNTGVMAPNNRLITYPTDKGVYVVVTLACPIINGVRQLPLLNASNEALNWMYPSDAALSPAPSLPVYGSPMDDKTALIGPAPDSAYGFEVTGTMRCTIPSANNASNYLSLYLADANIATAMVFWAGDFPRDYGTNSDEPQTWEAEFQRIITPAFSEERRKMFQSVGWTPRIPSPAASPPQS